MFSPWNDKDQENEPMQNRKYFNITTQPAKSKHQNIIFKKKPKPNTTAINASTNKENQSQLEILEKKFEQKNTMFVNQTSSLSDYCR